MYSPSIFPIVQADPLLIQLSIIYMKVFEKIRQGHIY